MKKVLLSLLTGMILMPCLSKAQNSNGTYQFYKQFFIAEHYAMLCIKSEDKSYAQGNAVLQSGKHVKSARESLIKLRSKITKAEFKEANEILDALEKITEQDSYLGQEGAKMQLLLALTDMKMSDLFPKLIKH